MDYIRITETSLSKLRSVIELQEGRIGNYPWTQVDSIAVSTEEKQQLEVIESRLINPSIHLMNESTIWSRGIYPLLVLAERDDIEAWAKINLDAQYPKFKLEGIADGGLVKTVAGRVTPPYLLVVEAQKGTEAINPLLKLYGQILGAACLNSKRDQSPIQTVFGCYTIADTWKFLRAEVEGIEQERPIMRVEYSREYVGRLESETICKILKGIVDITTEGKSL
ncbi:MAG: hypothetical protein F6K37_14705 [Moorea sp. SIO4E2]|uniref:hypothetical protein n=1 Tax=Moorena sp. SIO4E2 TaxID=2607826 RepID=UPI0013BB6481|nr:hypothetical protein [Moorena sp. SIO4E2]NEQ07140.1 hypothetical protein [Moorena sp. SIO4E2]